MSSSLVVVLLVAANLVHGWLDPSFLGGRNIHGFKIRRQITISSANNAYDTGPSWIKPVSQIEEKKVVAKSLDSSPSWLSAEQAQKWSTRKVNQPLFSKSGDALRRKIQKASSWRLRRRFVDEVPIEAISRGYMASAVIWIGAALDAALAKEATVASSFLIAAITAARLANATKNERLASHTYSRLTLFFAAFGWIHATLRYMSPAAFAAHFVTSASCFFGASRANSIAHLEPRSIIPQNKAATAMMALVFLPTFLAATSVAFYTKNNAQFALAAAAFSAIAIILTDAANRDRFQATTFKRLGLGLGIALVISATTGGLFKPLYDASILTSKALIPVSVLVTAAAAALPLFSSIRAILATKTL